MNENITWVRLSLLAPPVCSTKWISRPTLSNLNTLILIFIFYPPTIHRPSKPFINHRKCSSFHMLIMNKWIRRPTVSNLNTLSYVILLSSSLTNIYQPFKMLIVHGFDCWSWLSVLTLGNPPVTYGCWPCSSWSMCWTTLSVNTIKVTWAEEETIFVYIPGGFGGGSQPLWNARRHRSTVPSFHPARCSWTWIVTI